jgi:hypothetical protein
MIRPIFLSSFLVLASSNVLQGPMSEILYGEHLEVRRELKSNTNFCSSRYYGHTCDMNFMRSTGSCWNRLLKLSIELLWKPERESPPYSESGARNSTSSVRHNTYQVLPSLFTLQNACKTQLSNLTRVSDPHL